MSGGKNQSAKYQALSKLTLRAYGYIVAETIHVRLLGGLASRRPPLREVAAVPLRAAQRFLRAVGDVLGRMSLPGDLRAGPMHRVPSLRWQTWARLASMEAGSDWRSLSKLAIADGMLRDFALQPDKRRRGGVPGVRSWEDPSVTVAGCSTPANGAYSAATPRWASSETWHDGQQDGVRGWKDTEHCIAGSQAPGHGASAVAEPAPRRRGQVQQLLPRRALDEMSPSVTGGTGPSAGGLAVADPRAKDGHGGSGRYRISA